MRQAVAVLSAKFCINTVQDLDKITASTGKVNPLMSVRVSAFGQVLKIANQEVVQRLDKAS
ncbi:hypothetical protein H6G04_23295 [Calothrix membranacea FACHB-236]|nr:hypothetical protein [Calothrix membranacea FACHB-236]